MRVDAIREELAPLSFPLYFLDYETFSPAIPLFSGFRPFDKVPFQFSLHILHEPQGELQHVEYLHMEQSDPSEAVVQLLQQNIGEKGTIVAWNKSFEMDVHKKLAARLPEHRAFLERTISQFYDLKDVFHKQYYVHPAFRGSVSIKYVLPAIVPELQYKELSILGGAQASDAWWTMLSQGPLERAVIANDLKTYCGLDTYAMYAIWRHLWDLIKNV
jgi:Fe-S cluster biosynthesis and repair protein YggX